MYCSIVLLELVELGGGGSSETKPNSMLVEIELV